MRAQQCPQCGAGVRGEAAWCGLCYAHLGGAVPTGDGATTQPPARRAPAGAPSTGPGSGWPCASCGTLVPFEADACPDCGRGFLDGRSVPFAGRRLDSRGARVAVMAGGAIALAAVLIGVLVAVGSLL